MNNSIKTISFEGAEIIAVLDEPAHKIYLPIKNIAKNIGLNTNQIRNQHYVILNDAVLSSGMKKFSLPTSSGFQEHLCLDIEFIAIWLAKLRVTKKTIQQNPIFSHRIAAYQLKCKDVLTKAFFNTADTPPPENLEGLKIMLIEACDILAKAIQGFGKFEVMMNQHHFITNNSHNQPIMIPEKPLRAQIFDLVKNYSESNNMNIAHVWNKLYKEFKLRYRIDLKKMAEEKNEFMVSDKQFNALDVAEEEVLLEQLYEIAVFLFVKNSQAVIIDNASHLPKTMEEK